MGYPVFSISLTSVLFCTHLVNAYGQMYIRLLSYYLFTKITIQIFVFTTDIKPYFSLYKDSLITYFMLFYLAFQTSP